MYKPNGRRELGGMQSRPGKKCRVIRQICDTRPGRWAGLFISLSKEKMKSIRLEYDDDSLSIFAEH